MTVPLVSVGLVTWNSATKLTPTLDALSLQNYPNLQIIVVDNASDDDSVALVKKRFPDALIIRNAENRGFCGGHNQAIALSKGKYYLPLNPDVVMQTDYISSLVNALEQHSDSGSAAGKLLRETGIIDTTGLFINRRRQQYLRGNGEVDDGQYETPGDVFGVDGAAPLYRREMLEDIKVDNQYFDEVFFAHKEDVDVAWRARLLGWKCWYTPEAIGFHERNFKPGQREAISAAIKIHAVKNRYLLLIKNEMKSGWRRDGLQILWYDLKILVYLSFFERSSLKAISLVFGQWHRAQRWRRETMNRLRVDPIEMLRWFNY